MVVGHVDRERAGGVAGGGGVHRRRVGRRGPLGQHGVHRRPAGQAAADAGHLQAGPGRIGRIGQGHRRGDHRPAQHVADAGRGQRSGGVLHHGGRQRHQHIAIGAFAGQAGPAVLGGGHGQAGERGGRPGQSAAGDVIRQGTRGVAVDQQRIGPAADGDAGGMVGVAQPAAQRHLPGQGGQVIAGDHRAEVDRPGGDIGALGHHRHRRRARRARQAGPGAQGGVGPAAGRGQDILPGRRPGRERQGVRRRPAADGQRPAAGGRDGQRAAGGTAAQVRVVHRVGPGPADVGDRRRQRRGLAGQNAGRSRRHPQRVTGRRGEALISNRDRTAAINAAGG